MGRTRGALLAAVLFVTGIAAIAPPRVVHAAGERILLVAGNSSLTIADSAVRDLLVADGHVVTVVDDDVVTADSASGSDLVLISSSISPAKVGNTFRASTLPVVSWEAHLHDDLGLTAGGSANRGDVGSQRKLRIVDAGHPLAAGLSGDVTVGTTDTAFAFGRPAPAASVVARLVGSADRAVIFAYESGDEMVGLTAPAPRVGLFMSFATPKTLTSNGEVLVRTAIAWAIEAAGPPVNGPPTVDAGADRAAVVPATVSLAGSIDDDGRTAGVVTTWMQVAGPPVTIDDPGALAITVSIEVAETYLFRLEADDGEFVVSDDVTIEAREAGQRVGGAIAVYDFTEGAGVTVVDRSGVDPPLDLTVIDPAGSTWVPGGGLHLDGTTALATDGAAVRLTDAAGVEDTVTLEAWVTPQSAQPSTPGIIAQLGRSAGRRSVALSQGYWQSGATDRYEGHVRTSSSLVRATTARGSVDTDVTHLVVRRDEGRRVSVWIDGEKVTDKWSGGHLDSWDDAYPFLVGGDVDGARGFEGTVHYVALYGSALSDAEIGDNFLAGPASPGDDVAPAVTIGEVVPSATRVIVEVTTDERTTVTALGAPGGPVESDSGLSTEHVVTVGGLEPGTDVSLVVRARDPNGNETDIPLAVTTTPPGLDDTTFDIWYGPNQRFGHLGSPQRWVNVLGSVSDPDDIVEASYRLDDGPVVALGLGPDNRRLVATNDFNVELDSGALVAGVHVVVITAVDSQGNVATTQVTVEWQSGNATMPVEIDWSSVADVQDVGQVSDGRWVVDSAADVVGIGSADVGYDRILLIGSTDWTDYEVRTATTVIDIADEPGPLSAKPGFGFLVHWNGHNDSVDPGSQPHQGFRPDPAGVDPTPFGAITWWRDGRARVMNHRLQKVAAGALIDVVEGSTYELRMEVTTPGSKVRYRLKMWSAAQPEPTNWSVSWTSSGWSDEPGSGSLGLLAHEVQLQFGDVTVTPVG